MADEPTPPPMPIWVQRLREDLKRIAQAIGDLALGLDAKAKTDTRRHEETQGMLLAILVENRPNKIEVTPERPRRDSGDEHSDIFKVPTLPGVQVGMTRKAQREMLARIGKFALVLLMFILSHIIAYFYAPHPEAVPTSHPSSATLPPAAPPALPAPSIQVPALVPPPAHP